MFINTMTHWCNNVLLVTGLKAPRDAFIERLGDGSEILATFVPLIEGEICSGSWGTYLDVDTDYIERAGGEERIEMTTLAGPPYIWAAKVSAQYPELTFDLGFYVDTKPFQFYGHMRYENGHGKQVLFDNFNDDAMYNDEKDTWITTGKLKQFLDRFGMKL